MKTTIYTHKGSRDHDTVPEHPECPARIDAVFSLLEESPFSALPRKTANPADIAQIRLAHDADYVDRVMEAIPESGLAMLDSDTIVSAGSWGAAIHAAGAACTAVDDIASGATTRAFCAVRPPGHHAEAGKAMGFCLFNNVFIGARHAQVAHGFEKVAIVDFDVHHGNGTDSMARAHDGSIFFISTHQYPLWPMTGVPEDNDGRVENWTLPPGAGSDSFKTLYETKVFPALAAFKPDLLMISAGFDAHKDDPLGGLLLDDSDFEWVTARLCAIADIHCGGRVVSVMEGGYDLNALRNSVAAHLRALANLA